MREGGRGGRELRESVWKRKGGNDGNGGRRKGGMGMGYGGERMRGMGGR